MWVESLPQRVWERNLSNCIWSMQRDPTHNNHIKEKYPHHYQNPQVFNSCQVWSLQWQCVLVKWQTVHCVYLEASKGEKKKGEEKDGEAGHSSSVMVKASQRIPFDQQSLTVIVSKQSWFMILLCSWCYIWLLWLWFTMSKNTQTLPLSLPSVK